MARVHDQMNNTDEAQKLYHTVLGLDASHVESIACLAAYFFYANLPELALRFYRRLLHLGTSGASIIEEDGYAAAEAASDLVHG